MREVVRWGIYLGYGNGSFTLTIIHSIGDGTVPYAITAIDLNSDNRMDIVVSDIGTDSIGVLLGYGNGSFATVRMYSSGRSHPVSVAIGDMDNDNRLDIVVANDEAGSVGVLYGLGDGTFSAIQLSVTLQNYQLDSVVVCDLDNDGRLDIVLVSVFLGVTKISFRFGKGIARDEVISPSIANSQPRRVAVADFNSDNRLDLAVANHGSVVGILLNKGNQTTTPFVYYSTGLVSTPYCLDVGDFNNDNIVDIVVAGDGNDGIVVLFGVGDGTFLLARPYSIGIHSTAWGIAVGDFNKDTRLDVAVTDVNTHNMVVFLGGDSESFGSLTTYTTGEGSQPQSVSVADVNNDHQLDIVVANYGTDNVGVLLGRSGKEFTPINTYSTGSGSAPYSVALADFNKDDCLDIVVTASETDNIVVLFGNGNGTFITGRTYSTGYRSQPYSIVISDFNNDKRWDIAVANAGTSNILLFYGDGNGTFESATPLSLGYGYHPYSIAATDLNSDGWMDIVVACYDTDHIETFIQMC